VQPQPAHAQSVTQGIPYSRQLQRMFGEDFEQLVATLPAGRRTWLANRGDGVEVNRWRRRDPSQTSMSSDLKFVDPGGGAMARSRPRGKLARRLMGRAGGTSGETDQTGAAI